MTRWTLALLLLGVGCKPAPAPPLPPPVKAGFGDEALIGGTVSDGIRWLGLILGEYPVIDEPPGIIRGINGKDAAGTGISLCVDKRDLGFSENVQGRLQEVLRLKVIGVARRTGDGWACVGTVVRQLHSPTR